MFKLRMAAAASALLVSSFTHVMAAPPAGVKGALDGERIGLLPSENFRLRDGKCADCATLPQALWYFRDDVLAVPQPAQPISGFGSYTGIAQDVKAWSTSQPALKLENPGLVWLGAPHIFDDATLLPDGRQVRAADGSVSPLALVPKIPANLSYWNDKTSAFFAARQVRMRGTLKEVDGQSAFVARTVWPKDFAIDGPSMVARPLAANETLASFVQEHGGGASSPFATRLLWERNASKARAWQDKPVIGIMLNGAQGDDDEAYGGHFAIATGTMGKQGQWSDWLVNNFYNLDSFSEKGIVAAPVPMDNYLMDLNSGQQYYRPSYMLVAVLNNPRTAAAYQGGVQRVFNHFYRHDFTYRHAAANCAGISMDVFKGLGWHVPERGPTSSLKAIGAYGYVAGKEQSLTKGRQIYDYLTEEQVRLYPAVAFEAAGNDLMQLVGATPVKSPRELTSYEKQLRDDIEALVLVRIPQVPSSRVMGSNPVFSFDEFMARTPPDQKDWKIVPVGPRPFPKELRGNVPEVASPSPVPLPVAGIGALGLVGIGALVRRRARKKSAR
ncbi:hypothetical protein KY495_06105 [Massilia sp. PAMC28688]|uniref:hypothetical protein n=1 Tax=Massilia sp. PAMC28688 TaxID=2861283 RepID=UPI001C62E17D|nr:hypothetical protein [Massilia sp. PAMC28688]QYF94758.1 hypothetical protein KY495_06105 [Massilia sp. PAMC28688]